MKYILIFASILLTFDSYAQNKQDYNWLFGREASTVDDDKGYIFDFNSNPVGIKKRDNGIGIEGQNTSISDKDGNLLFYSNGCAVLNRNGDVMPNGNYIADTTWIQKLNKDCNRGYPGGQDILILPNPNGSDTYYLVNKPFVCNGLNVKDSIPIWYNIIDLELDNGNGDLKEKNSVLYDGKNCLSSFLTAIPHQNGNDFWIIQPLVDDSTFITFLLTENGFEKYPDQYTHEFFNLWRSSASGTAKFNNSGTKYALYNYYDQLHIYDFDRFTGILSNHQKINVYQDIDISDIRFSSIEWSPNDRFIYTASSLELYQVDTWEADIERDGIRLVAEWDGTNDPFSNTFYMMALAPDCKIYMCSTSGNNSYHVIKNPDDLGEDCNFCQSCLPLPEPANFGGMPNFPRFRVDAAEKCDSTIDLVLGLPVWYEEDLEVYPNPSHGIYTITIPQDMTKGLLKVFGINGKTIKSINISNQNKIDLDLTPYDAGQYIIELYQENSKDRTIYTAKVVKI